MKVLDFGLAKASKPRAAAPTHRIADGHVACDDARRGHDPGHGGLHGPGQAKGRPADKRSDVWAFGGVLYEMLTGQRAFEGETSRTRWRPFFATNQFGTRSRATSQPLSARCCAAVFEHVFES